MIPIVFVLACTTPQRLEVGAPDADVAEPGVLRLAAVGDAGEANASSRKVAGVLGEVCAARGCDLVLWLGDNLYYRGMDSPEDPRMDEVWATWDALDLPFYGVLGNHDYGHGRDRARAAHQLAWAAHQPDLTMPGPVYRFSAGPADLWALDTNLVFWHGEEAQAAWLDETLPDSGDRWRVAFGHHPYVSDGEHGNAGQYEGHGGLPIASGRTLERLFEGHLCGRVDLYLSGHEHNRQWHEVCGTEWIVSGAGSRTTPIVDRGNDPRFARAEEGLVWVELSPAGMQVAFYDEVGGLEYEGTTSR